MASGSLLCAKRLQKELRDLNKKPLEHIRACPREDNILEWHYVIEGTTGVFAGGWYHGKIIFLKEYPYKPPSIQMQTPNGRFKVYLHIILLFLFIPNL